MSYCIDRSYLGSSENFCKSSEGFFWSDTQPQPSWLLTGKHKYKDKCLDTLLALQYIDLPELPDRYVAVMNQLITGSNVQIPWQHVLPRSIYENYFKNTVKVIEDVFSELPFDYYETAWIPGTKLLRALKPAKINVEAWHKFLDEVNMNAPVLASFKSDSLGFAGTPTYNRFGTRTGRLTVTEGPNILTLKRDHRVILKSSFDDGFICSLDFRALEPRIVLAEAGCSSDADDIYGELAEKIFGDRLNRDNVKVAVISELYGAAKESLRARLGISQAKIDAFVRGINEFFKLDELRARLLSQAVSGRIINRFGRPLRVDPEAKNLFINTYVQSTGVDVSMIGFNSIIKQLGTDGVRPLYVLHDALILDVRSDRLKDVENISSVKVHGYEAAFPLKFEKMH